MRISASILCFVLTAPLLVSCGEREPTIDVAPEVGRDCFDTHIAALPNGTQYEGIERAVAGRVTIRVMTGVELTTLDCGLNPDGSLQGGGE